MLVSSRKIIQHDWCLFIVITFAIQLIKWSMYNCQKWDEFALKMHFSQPLSPIVFMIETPLRLPPAIQDIELILHRQIVETSKLLFCSCSKLNV